MAKDKIVNITRYTSGKKNNSLAEVVNAQKDSVFTFKGAEDIVYLVQVSYTGSYTIRILNPAKKVNERDVLKKGDNNFEYNKKDIINLLRNYLEKLGFKADDKDDSISLEGVSINLDLLNKEEEDLKNEIQKNESLLYIINSILKREEERTSRSYNLSKSFQKTKDGFSLRVTGDENYMQFEGEDYKTISLDITIDLTKFEGTLTELQIVVKKEENGEFVANIKPLYSYGADFKEEVYPILSIKLIGSYSDRFGSNERDELFEYIKK